MGQTKRIQIEIQEGFFEKLNQLVRQSPVYVKVIDTGMIGILSSIDPEHNVVEIHVGQQEENIICNINDIKPLL